MQQALDNLDVQYTYHVHEGSEGTSANGCYTTPVYHNHISSCTNICKGTMICVGGGEVNGSYMHGYKCNYCGRQEFSGGSEKPPWSCGKNLGGYGCGMSNTTIIGYTLGCGKTEETVESVTITY